MRKLRIVSDSASDILKLDYAEFASSPMKIITADREFVDDENLDVAQMADFLEQYKGKSQSSCPNPGDWLEAFGDADDVICATITSGLSGSYNTANTAKQLYEAEHEGRRVFVLDSLSAGPEIALAIYKIEECAQSGMEFDAICEYMQNYLKRTGLIFMLKSLRNFANNGRVSPIIAKIAGLAGICIVGKASEKGTLEPLHKSRGEARAVEALMRELEEQGFQSGKVIIDHCQNEAAADKLKDMIAQKFQSAQIVIHETRGLCSFYAEKGGLLVGFEKA